MHEPVAAAHMPFVPQVDVIMPMPGALQEPGQMSPILLLLHDTGNTTLATDGRPGHRQTAVTAADREQYQAADKTWGIVCKVMRTSQQCRMIRSD